MKRPSVLIVEDESHLREILRFQLESAGFFVREAQDGEDAWQAILSSPPELLLTDFMMPRCDGIELLRRVRAHSELQRLPVILLTAKSTFHDRVEGLLAGANDYITKPWETKELTLRISNLIRIMNPSATIVEPSLHCSCFISYTTADSEFASRLHKDLIERGVQCWKWDEDAKLGEPLWSEIDRAIRAHEKVIVIASKSSLCSPAVLREIERAILEEDRRMLGAARGDWSGPTSVLLPIRLDDYILDGWDHPRKADVIQKVIGDARSWREHPEAYLALLTRLETDLVYPGTA